MLMMSSFFRSTTRNLIFGTVAQRASYSQMIQMALEFLKIFGKFSIYYVITSIIKCLFKQAQLNYYNSLLNFSCVSMYFLCSLSSISRLAIIACSCLSISSSMLLELLSIGGGTGGGFSLGGAFILGCPTKSLSLKTCHLRG